MFHKKIRKHYEKNTTDEFTINNCVIRDIYLWQGLGGESSVPDGREAVWEGARNAAAIDGGSDHRCLPWGLARWRSKQLFGELLVLHFIVLVQLIKQFLFFRNELVDFLEQNQLMALLTSTNLHWLCPLVESNVVKCALPTSIVERLMKHYFQF